MTTRASRPQAPQCFQVRWSGDASGKGSTWEIEHPDGPWEPLLTRRGAPSKHAREGELAEHARNWARSKGLAVGRTVEVTVACWPPRGRVPRVTTSDRSATPGGSGGGARRVVFTSRRMVVGTFVTTGIEVPVDLGSSDAPGQLRERWEAEVVRRAAKNGLSN